MKMQMNDMKRNHIIEGAEMHVRIGTLQQELNTKKTEDSISDRLASACNACLHSYGPHIAMAALGCMHACCCRERAALEKVSLEHKLKLARLERAKQLAAAEGAEDRSRAELDGVRVTAVTVQRQTCAECEAAREDSQAGYLLELAELQPQVGECMLLAD